MRKMITFVATTGRDKGKIFEITEMSARKAHKWATRAIFAIMNAGLDIPSAYVDAGFAGLAAVIKAGEMELATMLVETLGRIQYEQAGPLLDELMDCVRIIPDAKNMNVIRDLIEDDIEEVTTIFILQKEVLALHANFSTPAE
jgi:hypothetical protein